jgi:hypothetical protein
MVIMTNGSDVIKKFGAKNAYLNKRLINFGP